MACLIYVVRCPHPLGYVFVFYFYYLFFTGLEFQEKKFFGPNRSPWNKY